MGAYVTIDLLAISRFAYLLPILPQPPSLQGGEPEIEDAGLPQAPHNDGDEEPEDLFGHLDDVKFASTIGIFGHLDDVKFASTIGIIAHGEYGSNSDGTILRRTSSQWCGNEFYARIIIIISPNFISPVCVTAFAARGGTSKNPIGRENYLRTQIVLKQNLTNAREQELFGGSNISHAL